MLTKTNSLILTVLIVSLNPLLAKAINEPEAEYSVGFPAMESTTTYFNEIYVSTTRTDAFFRDLVTLTPLASDIRSTQTIRARVDSSGSLIDGTITWTGSSEQLGIARGSSLLTATIAAVEYQPDNFSFLFRARIDTVNPVITQAIGPMKTLIARDFILPFEWFENGDWSTPFQETSFTSSPDIFLSPFALPAFRDEILTEVTALYFGNELRTSSYTLATNTYTLDGSFGEGGGEVLVRILETSEQILQDLDASIQLSAIVSENGAAQSGTFSIVGTAPSIGAVASTVLLGGTVLEAHYATGGIPAGIQFLLQVDTIFPGLRDVVGELRTIVLIDYHAPNWSINPWQSSFTSTSPFTSSPEIYATTQEYAISDLDGDGLANRSDNCFQISNVNQRDVDLDGIGSLCDTDFNNDCAVNFLDFTIFRNNFLGSNPNIDVNADGVVNFLDLSVLVDQFLLNFNVDNPSQAPNICVNQGSR